ncbi:hypothetical protein Hanom_Chr07g00593811 [Helianthus anomalus]
MTFVSISVSITIQIGLCIRFCISLVSSSIFNTRVSNHFSSISVMLCCVLPPLILLYLYC